MTAPDWQDPAACHGLGNLFFGADDETQRDRAERTERAAAVCAGCLVRGDCAAFAEAHGIWWGVWAGEDRESSRPAPDDPPVLCGKGLHLMTAENTKPVAGTARVRCRECWRITDRRTRPGRDARRYQRQREQRRAA